MLVLLAWLSTASAAEDSAVISRGEAVDLADHLAPDKFTVVEFGAGWCGSCRIAERTIERYVAQWGDVAVREIELDAEEPRASFSLPVAKQYLRKVAGLPWLLVFGPDGETIYEGASVHDALGRLDLAR